MADSPAQVPADAFVRAFLEAMVLPIEATELEHLWTSLQSARPTLRVDPRGFAEHLAAMAIKNGRQLGGIAFSDLYLAFACGSGDRAALAEFERERMAEVPAFVARFSLEREQLSELLQRIRERLFVASQGEPRILGYSGQGPLGGWLRMVAVRVAVDLQRSLKADADTAFAPALSVDPELAYVKARHAAAFRAAMASAFEALSDREATLLRLRYAEGLDTQQLAAMYGVSARTVQRWLGEAHEAVERSVRKLLAQGGRLSETELASLLLLIESELNLTLSGLRREGQ